MSPITVAITTLTLITLITLHLIPTLLNPSHHSSIHPSIPPSNPSTKQLSLSFPEQVHDTHPKQPNEHAN
jgi:hypothetical protein